MSETINIQGWVTFVSEKTKGIQLDNKDVWYNPSNELKEKINKAMIGRLVVLNYKDKEDKKFYGFSFEGEAEEVKQSSFVPKEERTDLEMKYRAMCLSYAKDLMVCYMNRNNEAIVPKETIEKDILKIADEFYNWVVG